MPRKTEYTPEIAQEICEAIENSSQSLDKICASNPDWPTGRTVRKWLSQQPSFVPLYAQAKMKQAEYMVEEIIEISDDTSRDTLIKTNKEGEEYEVANNEWINRSRLRVDTRKWLAAKLAPKVYGDKTQTDHGVAQNSFMEGILDKLSK